MGGSPEIRGELIIKEKRCKECKLWLPVDKFYVAGIRKDGLGVIYQPYCKECDGARKRNYIALHRFKDRENSKKKRAKRKIEISWYKNREMMCLKLYRRKFERLTELQKRVFLLKRLYTYMPHLLPEEIKALSVMIENKAYDWASKTIFKPFTGRITNEQRSNPQEYNG